MWQSTLGDFSSPLERITALLYYYTPSTATMARMAPGVKIVPARLYISWLCQPGSDLAAREPGLVQLASHDAP